MPQARILLVDDDPVNICMLRALLGHSDYEYISLDSGQSALALARQNPTFDLIILDVVLPDINGIEVCRELKQDPTTSHMPVVLLSAVQTDDSSISQGLDVGADGYITKPIEDNALRAWVKATLKLSALQRQVAQSQVGVGETKLPMLERVAALAHAVNNPLQSIYASADLLAMDLDGEEKHKSLIGDILRSAAVIKKLVEVESVAARNQLDSTGMGKT